MLNSVEFERSNKMPRLSAENRERAIGRLQAGDSIQRVAAAFGTHYTTIYRLQNQLMPPTPPGTSPGVVDQEWQPGPRTATSFVKIGWILSIQLLRPPGTSSDEWGSPWAAGQCGGDYMLPACGADDHAVGPSWPPSTAGTDSSGHKLVWTGGTDSGEGSSSLTKADSALIQQMGAYACGARTWRVTRMPTSSKGTPGEAQASWFGEQLPW